MGFRLLPFRDSWNNRPWVGKWSFFSCKKKREKGKKERNFKLVYKALFFLSFSHRGLFARISCTKNWILSMLVTRIVQQGIINAILSSVSKYHTRLFYRSKFFQLIPSISIFTNLYDLSPFSLSINTNFDKFRREFSFVTKFREMLNRRNENHDEGNNSQAITSDKKKKIGNYANIIVPYPRLEKE